MGSLDLLDNVMHIRSLVIGVTAIPVYGSENGLNLARLREMLNDLVTPDLANGDVVRRVDIEFVKKRVQARIVVELNGASVALSSHTRDAFLQVTAADGSHRKAYGIIYDVKIVIPSQEYDVEYQFSNSGNSIGLVRIDTKERFAEVYPLLMSFGFLGKKSKKPGETMI